MKVTQSCPTFCDPMDDKVHGILQASILGWVSFPFSRRSSQPMDRSCVCCIAGRCFNNWVVGEAQKELPLLREINSPGKNARVGHQALLQGIFLVEPMSPALAGEGFFSFSFFLKTTSTTWEAWAEGRKRKLLVVEDGIQTHTCRAQWISSSPLP